LWGDQKLSGYKKRPVERETYYVIVRDPPGIKKIFSNDGLNTEKGLS